MIHIFLLRHLSLQIPEPVSHAKNDWRWRFLEVNVGIPRMLVVTVKIFSCYFNLSVLQNELWINLHFPEIIHTYLYSHISRPRSSKYCDTIGHLSIFSRALRLCIIYIIFITQQKIMHFFGKLTLFYSWSQSLRGVWHGAARVSRENKVSWGSNTKQLGCSTGRVRKSDPAAKLPAWSQQQSHVVFW